MDNDIQKIYRALVIDTNTIKTSSFKFKNGKLASLEQFSDSEFYFLMPEIIKREVEKHYKLHLLNAKNEAINKLNTISNYNISSLDPKVLIEDLRNVDTAALAIEHIEDFIASTGAIELSIQEYGNLEEVVDDYFNTKPPFAKAGDKKAEFPDAICLQMINKWADRNGANVLAVSRDKDWFSYVDSKDNMDITEELEDALAIFVKQNSYLKEKIEFVTDLFKATTEPKLNEIIKDSITDQLDNSFFEIQANSDIGVELDFDSVTYLNHEIGNFNIVEINLNNREIVINYLLNINVELHATADFYHWDKEDNKPYSLASDSKYSEEVITGDLTLKFIFPDDIEDILDIESLDKLWLEESTLELETTYFDLGYIEPDFS